MIYKSEVFLPTEKAIIPPVEGWEEDGVYLVGVSYGVHNPVHNALLHVGFLTKENTPGSYSQIWKNNYGEPEDFSNAFYLEVFCKLGTCQT